MKFVFFGIFLFTSLYAHATSSIADQALQYFAHKTFGDVVQDCQRFSRDENDDAFLKEQTKKIMLTQSLQYHVEKTNDHSSTDTLIFFANQTQTTLRLVDQKNKVIQINGQTVNLKNERALKDVFAQISKALEPESKSKFSFSFFPKAEASLIEVVGGGAIVFGIGYIYLDWAQASDWAKNMQSNLAKELSSDNSPGFKITEFSCPADSEGQSHVQLKWPNGNQKDYFINFRARRPQNGVESLEVQVNGKSQAKLSFEGTFMSSRSSHLNSLDDISKSFKCINDNVCDNIKDCADRCDAKVRDIKERGFISAKIVAADNTGKFSTQSVQIHHITGSETENLSPLGDLDIFDRMAKCCIEKSILSSISCANNMQTDLTKSDFSNVSNQTIK